jgi:NAD(P)-dependent dehydrogenase (short-subunit alcohol dehydrogenase family)
MAELKRVLVTGGTQGIGRELVSVLANDGYEVHFTFNRSASRAREICERFRGRVFAHQLDQGCPASIRSASFLAIESWWGVVFNAGVGSATVLNHVQQRQMPEAVDEAMLRINALGPLHLYRLMRPTLLTQDSVKIVFVSSVGGGVSAFPNFLLSDGMSKAALSFLAKQLAVENTHTGIDVFTVCPGATNTAMFEESTLGKLDAAGRARFVSSLPKRRLIEPSEIADWIRILMRPGSTVLHGCVIDASAGLGVRPGILTEAR